MPRPLAVLIALAMFVLALAPASAAEYYKWVDDDGVTHYSQEPPPNDIKAKVEEGAITLPQTSKAKPTNADGAGDAGGDSEEAEGEGEDEQGSAVPETVAEFCQNLREREGKLTSDRDIRIKQSDGSLKPLEGDAREQELQRVRDQLEMHCDGQG